jgi:hypothetical protein
MTGMPVTRRPHSLLPDDLPAASWAAAKKEKEERAQILTMFPNFHSIQAFWQFQDRRNEAGKFSFQISLLPHSSLPFQRERMGDLLSVLGAIYGSFSPWSIASLLSRYIGARPNPGILLFILALAAGLIIGGRKTWNMIFLSYGAATGFALSLLLVSALDLSGVWLIALILVPLISAVLFYRLSRLLVSAAVALTGAGIILSLTHSAAYAAVVSVAAFAVSYVFYKGLSSLLAALLGSSLLMLFFIELGIPFASPLVLSLVCFSTGMLLRYLVSVIGGQSEGRRSLFLNAG